MLVDRPLVGPSTPGEKMEVTQESNGIGRMHEESKEPSAKIEPPRQRENDGRHGHTQSQDGAGLGEPESPRSGSEAETIVLPGANGEFSPAKRRIVQHRDRDVDDEQKVHERAAPTARPEEGSREGDHDGKDKVTEPALSTVKHEEADSKDADHGAARPSGRAGTPSTPPAKRSPARQSSSTYILAPPSPPGQSRSSKDPDEKSHDGRSAMGEKRSVSEAARRSSTAPQGKKAGTRRASHHSAQPPPVPESSSSTTVRPPKRAASTQSTSRRSSEAMPKRRKLPSLAVDVPHTHRTDAFRSDDYSSSTSPTSPDASRPQHPRRPRQRQEQQHQQPQQLQLQLQPPPPSSSSINAHKIDVTESSLTSPVKMPFYSKIGRDHNGRTRLARACDLGELNNARLRLEERPGDLDLPDYAGNSPLQIASLHGYIEIVNLLIANGANVNRTNNDRDTPLIDAVENRHTEVIRSLLAAGAEPNQRGHRGFQPLELLDSRDERDEADQQIRTLLQAALKDRPRRSSHDQSASATTAAATSPQSSTTAGPAERVHPPPPTTTTTGRRRNVRADATRNDLLWMHNTHESLRDRAGKGDMEGVGTILEVLQTADVESLVAAARGGHDEVMQLLLGIGNADADPEPLSSHRPGHNTPMLAGIGGGNEKVIQLLLSQPTFDPTRRDHRGKRYYEIAEERQGPNWQAEYRLLKEAYDRATHPAPEVEEPGSPAVTRESRATTTEEPVARPRRKLVSGKELSGRGRQRRSSRSPRSAETDSMGTRAGRSKRPHDSASPPRSPRSRSHPTSPRGSTERGQGKRSKRARGTRETAEGLGSELAKMVVGDVHVDGREITSGDPMEVDVGHNEKRGEEGAVDAGATTSPGENIPADSINGTSPSPVPVPSHPPSFINDRPSGTAQPSENVPENHQPLQEGSRRASPTIQTRSEHLDPAEDTAQHERQQAERKAEEERKRVEEVNKRFEEQREKQKQAWLKAEAARKRAEEHREKQRQAALKVEEERKRVEEERKRVEEQRERQKQAEFQADEERKAREAEEKRAAEERRQRQEAQRRREAQEAHERAEQQRQHQRAQAEIARREALPFALRRIAETSRQGVPTTAAPQLHLLLATIYMTEGPAHQPGKVAEWMSNVQATLILGIDDLPLSILPNFARRVVTAEHRNSLWFALRSQLQDRAAIDQGRLSAGQSEAITFAKFRALQPLFWIKVEDFLAIRPHFPHLNGLVMERLALAGTFIFFSQDGPVMGGAGGQIGGQSRGHIGGHDGTMDEPDSTTSPENDNNNPMIWRHGFWAPRDNHQQVLVPRPLQSQPRSQQQPVTNGTSEGASSTR
ncbi:MAG: hypothetical protein M1823_003599 [Watsoniomyces obsoletus]|nr:MAG: hypothetical protein M1823_003599 [Watsoniomyces obsoletus]